MSYDLAGKALHPLLEALDELELPFAEYIPKDMLDGIEDRLFYTDADGHATLDEYQLNLRLAFEGELALTPPGLPGIALVVGGDGPGWTSLQAEFVLGPEPGAILRDVEFVLRVDRTIFKPMLSRTEVDEAKPGVDIPLGRLSLMIGKHGFSADIDITASIPLAMIGDTGVLIEASNVRPILGPLDNPPPGLDPTFRGIVIGHARIYLPEGMPELVPSDLTIDNCSIGTGGFTGSLALNYAPAFDPDGRTFSGPGAGSLFGLEFGVASVALSFVQNTFEASSVSGTMVLPFFEQPISVDITIAIDGALSVALSAIQPKGVTENTGIIEFEKPGLLKLSVDSLGFSLDHGVFTAKLSGAITPLALGPNAPSFEVRELAIDSQGHVHIDGGWLDLPRQYAIDFFGFKLEITKVGFGNAVDGGKWVGFSGGLKLVDGLQAGASVEGLRITWYDDGRPPAISFNGIGVEFEVPDVLRFKGEIAYRELPDNVHRFDGAITLDLVCIGLSVDAMLVVGTSPGYTFFAIYVDVELPAGIPLFSTGLGLYGFAGLFALNMEPDKRPDEPWYGMDPGNSWFHRGTPGVTDLKNKWRNQDKSLALGAGVTIGTLSDNGFIFSGKKLLVIAFPGPVILLEGRANLLKERAKLGAEEPTFRSLAVLDSRAGALTFGLDARYRYGTDGELIDIRGSTEAYFNFADPGAWHIYIGRKQPTEQRIRADLFKLFEANTYFELAARGLAIGAWIGFDRSWSFDLAKVTLEAWIEGGADVSFRPAHCSADLWMHGKVDASACGVSVNVSIDAKLRADAFTPFQVVGEFDLRIRVPLCPDITVRVPLQWGPTPTSPPLPLPLKEIAVEHFKTTTSWPLPRNGDDPLLLPKYDGDTEELHGILDPSKLHLAAGQAMAPPPANLPVVPLDGRPHITFGRAVNDVAEVGNKAQVRIAPEWEQIGDPAKGEGPEVVRYSLVSVALHRWVEDTRSWAQVTETPGPEASRLWGSWAPLPSLPDGGSADPTQTKLWLWSKNPFDYTRRTSGAWDEWFSGRFRDYPCPSPPLEHQVCIDFEALPFGRFDGGPYPSPTAELIVHCSPSIHTTVRHLEKDVDEFSRGLASPSRGFEERIWVSRPEATGMRCTSMAIRILGGGGDRESDRTCVNFAERAVGPAPLWESGVMFYRLEQLQPGVFLPASVVALALDGNVSVSGRDCSGTLVMVLMNPAHRVELTLTQRSTETTPSIDVDIQPGTNRSITVDDDPSDAHTKHVVITGETIVAVMVNASPGQMVLREVCCERDYAFHLVAQDGDTTVGPFLLDSSNTATAVGHDLRRVDVRSVGPYCLLQICATLSSAEAIDAYAAGIRHTQEELVRWSQPDVSLEAHRTYRLTVSTRAEVKQRPDSAQLAADHQITEFAYFRTEGPPGLADLSVPRGAAGAEQITLRDRDGTSIGTRGNGSARPVLQTPLNSLTPYIRQTVPQSIPAATERPPLPRPIYRAYDMAVSFNENSYVEAMYRQHRRDLALYLFTAANQPARNTAGSLVVAADHWSQAETLDLDASDQRWITAVNSTNCVSLDPGAIQHNARLVSGAAERVLEPESLYEARLQPLLLHEDFSQGLAGWTPRDDGMAGGPSAWRATIAGTPPAPFLEQTSGIHGGLPDALDPLKPGTVLLRADDPRLPADHPDQPEMWSDCRVSVYLRVHPGGAVGIVVRDRGAGDLVRFATGPEHWMLVGVASGAHTILASGQYSLQPDRDYLVAVEAMGPALRVHVDGAALATVTDDAAVGLPVTGGRVGLYCWNDPHARFTDLRVDDLRATAPVLHRFSYVTSRYASFFHHVHSFQDEIRRLRLAGSPHAVLLPLLAQSAAAPSSDPATRAAVSDAEARAFEALVGALAGAAAGGSADLIAGAAVTELQVTRVDGHLDFVPGAIGFLVQSPEPIDWRRVTLEVFRGPSWTGPAEVPHETKITDVTLGGQDPNQESVTLLLREASDLAGVVIERLRWAPGVDPAALPGGPWSFVDDGDLDGPSRWTLGDGGELRQTSGIHGVGPDDPGTCALAGDRVWTDFRLQTTLRSDVSGAMGVVFRYRDPGNYYRFSMMRPSQDSPGPGYRRLIVRIDGQTQILWQDSVAYSPKQSYALLLECDGSTLAGTLDGQPLFAIAQEWTHPTGRVGLYCSANSAVQFADTMVALHEWVIHHAFAREALPLPAGTRVRLHSGNRDDPHAEEPGVVDRFAATGAEHGQSQLPAGGVLRVRTPEAAGGHMRSVLPDGAYQPVEMRVLRNADGTAFFVSRKDGSSLEPGEHRLSWTFHRDNRAVDPASPVLGQAGLTAPERARIDLPWRPLWIAERVGSGVYPSAVTGVQDRAAVEERGTEIVVLKNLPGPLDLQLNSYTRGLAGGDLAETDIWVVSPSGRLLWHGERIDMTINDPGLPVVMRDGLPTKHLERSIETTETGLFRVLIGSRAFPLIQPLSNGLPEALVVKPAARGAVYQWGDSRGTFLNLGREPMAMEITSSRGDNQRGGLIRIVDEDRYVDLPYEQDREHGIWLTIEHTREIELQAGFGTDGAVGRMTALGTALFGSDADVRALAGVVISRIIVTPSSYTMADGLAAAFSAMAYDGFGNPLPTATIDWATADVMAAAFQHGSALQGTFRGVNVVVHGIKDGVTTLTASSGGMSATVQLDVRVRTIVLVQVAVPQTSLIVGDAVQASVAVKDNTGSIVHFPVTWTTGDAAVATVSPAGLITAVGPGATTITATSAAASGALPITVAVAPAVFGTNSPLTWHVETSGSDTTGDGSVDNPFATPMGAIRALKTRSGGLIHHVVQILIGAGNFPGFDLASFIVEPLDDGTTPASLLVSGTLTTFTPPSGSGTGTLASVTAGNTATGTWTVLSDSTQNWPVNGLVGYFVELLTGTGAGNVFPILSNTATDLTIPSFVAISATGATYAIRDCSSVITTAIQLPGAVVGQNSPTPQSAVTQNVGFAVRDISGATNGTTWARVEQLKVNLGSPSAAFLDCHVSNPRGVTVTRCHFTTAQGTRASFFGPGYATFSNNILTSATANTSLSSAATFGSLQAPGLSVSSNHFRYRTAGAVALSVGGGSMLIANNQFDGDVVMSIGGPPGGYQFAGINRSPSKTNQNFGIRARSISNGPAGHIIHVTGWLEMGGSGASSAIWLVGPHSIIVDGTLVGSNNLVALNLARGARAQISAASTITGTTEVSLDGVTTTLASMRAQSPKVLTNSYGTTIYE